VGGAAHPTHSPDLCLCHFHLFGSLKEHLGGQWFNTIKSQKAVQSAKGVLHGWNSQVTRKVDQMYTRARAIYKKVNMVSYVDIWKNKNPDQISTLSPLYADEEFKGKQTYLFFAQFHVLFSISFIHVLIKL
jgi:hypothetical protein